MKAKATLKAIILCVVNNIICMYFIPIFALSSKNLHETRLEFYVHGVSVDLEHPHRNLCLLDQTHITVFTTTTTDSDARYVDQDMRKITMTF